MKAAMAALLLPVLISAGAAELGAARQALAGPSTGWPQALADFSAAAHGGEAAAAYWAGVMVRNGKGTAPSSAGAIGWLEQAARGGVPEAMFVLANMRIEGEGGPADPAAGRAWLERAAAAGHPAALLQLAQLSYEEGSGERANGLMKEAAHALKHRAGAP